MRIRNRGKLWDRYTNLLKTKNPKTNDLTRPASPSEHGSDLPDNDLEDVGLADSNENARTYLLYNFEKSDEVMKKWIECYDYRCKKMETYGSNITDILLDWSIIAKPFGVDLVI